jgi:hypothetical protein
MNSDTESWVCWSDDRYEHTVTLAGSGSQIIGIGPQETPSVAMGVAFQSAVATFEFGKGGRSIQVVTGFSGWSGTWKFRDGKLIRFDSVCIRVTPSLEMPAQRPSYRRTPLNEADAEPVIDGPGPRAASLCEGKCRYCGGPISRLRIGEMRCVFCGKKA